MRIVDRDVVVNLEPCERTFRTRPDHATTLHDDLPHTGDGIVEVRESSIATHPEAQTVRGLWDRRPLDHPRCQADDGDARGTGQAEPAPKGHEACDLEAQDPGSGGARGCLKRSDGLGGAGR